MLFGSSSSNSDDQPCLRIIGQCYSRQSLNRIKTWPKGSNVVSRSSEELKKEGGWELGRWNKEGAEREG